ncbi:hypothetical protein yc1106_07182 [Curvularia clavata]|uniref:Probable double zinc ribbon domain-containing protein n=1 Tax=Curvularia clavata TaxID=95742 RepID=A0A9Q8ZGT3_CURCL|nr:hypothetical protein yc1106_07182 [Curvularia clavata]
MSPLTFSANHNGSSGPSAETVHPEQKRSLNQQNGVPNISSLNTLSTSGALAPNNDGEGSGNQLGVDNIEQERCAAVMCSMPVMDGTYKFASTELTPKIPGSVAHARAIAMSRLRPCTSVQSFRACSKDAEGPAESVPSSKSSTVTFVDQDDKSSSPVGIWRCCTCNREHDVYSFSQGRHPVSTLQCVCTHRSCYKCALEGLLKPFVPICEPEVVPLSDDGNKEVRFGVICDGCGRSWRAQKAPEETHKKAAMKSALLRVTAIPKRLQKGKKNDLRASRSMDNLRAPLLTASKSTLNLRILANEMTKEHGEQADMVSVRFSGIKCSCGMVTDSGSLCFQIVDPPRDFYRVQFIKQMAGRRVSGFGTTPEDQAKGHGTPSLVLKGGCTHPNPLMSSPVL